MKHCELQKCFVFINRTSVQKLETIIINIEIYLNDSAHDHVTKKI